MTDADAKLCKLLRQIVYDDAPNDSDIERECLAAADRIEALAAQVAQLKREAQTMEDEYNEAVRVAVNARVERDLSALRLAAADDKRDAERWRTARTPPFGIADWTEFAKPLIRTGTSADERIDAAIAAIGGRP